MERRIFGLENEYGVTCTLRGQRRLSPDEVARYLFRRVVSWGRSSNVFLENGARLYLDVGNDGAKAYAGFMTGTGIARMNPYAITGPANGMIDLNLYSCFSGSPVDLPPATGRREVERDDQEAQRSARHHSQTSPAGAAQPPRRSISSSSRA